ncbi:hypothetical protein [Micromonospora sp. 4G55]|uniref:hypothetical protein n=1 Tax=Micromonospora sp. 4G55 TaxID=2806102 RepID=UPI001A62D049|nr:hypothetical protein [Micromonospora sp. 4G55]MBM0260108.1 hypothetical protein [Micromonospora sp. 4G55]
MEVGEVCANSVVVAAREVSLGGGEGVAGVGEHRQRAIVLSRAGYRVVGDVVAGVFADKVQRHWEFSSSL